MSDGTPLPNRTEETPVSGRNYPEDDPEGRRWSEIWRAAIEEVNANALVSDIAANRLDHDPKDGMLFVPTDGGNWYLGDGSGWRDLGPIGDIGDHIGDATNPHEVTASQSGALPTSGGTVTGDTAFANTTHDSIDTEESYSRDSPVINAKWFGATGDGSTNDQPSIQSALDHADSIGGGTVYLPPGEYVLEGSGYAGLSLYDNVSLAGAGRFDTVINSKFNVDGRVDGTVEDNSSGIIVAQGEPGDLMENVEVRDLKVIVTADWPRRGISYNYVRNGVVDSIAYDSTVLDSDSDPSWAEGVPTWLGGSEHDIRSENLVIRDSYVKATPGNNPAIEVCGVDGAIIEGCVADTRGSVDNAAMKIQAVDGCIHSNNIHLSNDDGCDFLSCNNVTSTNNALKYTEGDEANSGDSNGFNIGGPDTPLSREGYSITGNTIEGYANDGVKVFSGVSNFSIVGNTVRGCDTGVMLNSRGADGIISSNIFDDLSGYGISNDGGSQNALGLVVSGNTFRGLGAAGVSVYCHSGPGGVTISNNSFDIGDGAIPAIEILEDDTNGAEYIMITGNQTSWRDSGIDIPDVATTFIVTSNISDVNYGGTTGSSEVVANNVSI